MNKAHDRERCPGRLVCTDPGPVIIVLVVVPASMVAIFLALLVLEGLERLLWRSIVALLNQAIGFLKACNGNADGGVSITIWQVHQKSVRARSCVQKEVANATKPGHGRGVTAPGLCSWVT